MGTGLEEERGWETQASCSFLTLLCPEAMLDTEQELYRYQQTGLSITDQPSRSPHTSLPYNTVSFFPDDGEGIQELLLTLSKNTPGHQPELPLVSHRSVQGWSVPSASPTPRSW